MPVALWGQRAKGSHENVYTLACFSCSRTTVQLYNYVTADGANKQLHGSPATHLLMEILSC